MKYNSSHTQYFDKNGIELPSVTTILKILNKPSLVKWANFLGFKRQRVDDILAKTSEIGVMVHDLVESYLLDHYFIFVPSIHCTKSLLYMYLNTIIEWRRTHNIQVEFIEKRFCSEKFAGTIDFYGLVDGKWTIFDFKTSKKPYSSMFLQLAAYCIMIEEKGYKVDQVGIIILNPDGFNEKIITRDELDDYIRVFKILVELFHEWFEINIKKGWGNILS